mgnify:CR=1 FL=1
MKVTGIIPARLQSSRLPGKLLLTETGKPLIQHAWESASCASVLAGKNGDEPDLLIATDSLQIAATVTGFGAQVEMTKEPEGQLVIKAGRSRFALSCLPTEDFPVLGSGELPHQFKLPVHDLKTLLDRTRFAISTEETRYYLNGIFLHVSDADQPVLKAVVGLTAVAFVVIQVLTELFCRRLDPRLG